MNGWYKHVMYKPSKYGWFTIALQTDIFSGFVSSTVTQPSHCYPLGLQWQPRPVSAHLPNFCLGPWHAMARHGTGTQDLLNFLQTSVYATWILQNHIYIYIYLLLNRTGNFPHVTYLRPSCLLDLGQDQ